MSNDWGVVDTDNYAGDYPAEKFVLACWHTKECCEAVAKALNNETGPEASRYFKVVQAPYELQPGLEALVKPPKIKATITINLPWSEHYIDVEVESLDAEIERIKASYPEAESLVIVHSYPRKVNVSGI